MAWSTHWMIYHRVRGTCTADHAASSGGDDRCHGTHPARRVPFGMRRLITLIGLFIVLPVAGMRAQGQGSVRGTIRFASGAPLSGGLVGIPPRVFLGIRIDSGGRFHLTDLPTGNHALEVVCPFSPYSPSGLAVPVAARPTVAIVAGRESVLDVVVPDDGCRPIPSREIRVRWRGAHYSAFENVTFSPCESDSLARELRSYGHPMARRAWVRFQDSAWGRSRLRAMATDTVIGGLSGFLEVSGILRGPQPSGHMGMSNYELLVDSIFSVLPRGRC